MAEDNVMTGKKQYFNDLESYLQTTLIPVKPRPEFVRTLKSNIAQPGVRYKTELNLGQTMLFFVAGVLSSVLLLVACVQAISYLSHSFRKLRLNKPTAF